MSRFGRTLVLASRFNEMITKALADGAMRILQQDGEAELLWVPGAFELPLAAKKAAESGRYDGVVCLGAIIKGDTPHFDFVAQACAQGIMDATLSTSVPISFGVLTTNTSEEALSRAGLKGGNKGEEAAHALRGSQITLKEIGERSENRS